MTLVVETEVMIPVVSYPVGAKVPVELIVFDIAAVEVVNRLVVVSGQG